MKCCEPGKVNIKNHNKRWFLWISLILGFFSSFLLIFFIKKRKTYWVDKDYPCSSPQTVLPEITVEIADIHEQKPDDLTIIVGIGPKISYTLNSIGINSYKKLSEKDPDDLRKILLQHQIRLNDPETWPEQARLASLNQMEKLKEFQNEIKNKKG